MMPRVRNVTLFFGLIAAVVFSGCSVAEQDAGAVGDQFQRGIQGQGKIVPRDPASDAFGSDYN